MEGQVSNPLKVKHYEKIVDKRFSNYKLMLYFGLVTISILFITLSALYLFSKSNVKPGQMTLELNPLFYASTFFLLISSVGLMLARKAFHDDDYKPYKISLWISNITGTMFVISQVFAWLITWNKGFNFEHNSASYLYVISGLHLAHMLGGIIFLVYYSFNSFPRLKDSATSIFYFTDPVAKHQLKNLSLYWHFMGGLWLYLLVFFLLAH